MLSFGIRNEVSRLSTTSSFRLFDLYPFRTIAVESGTLDVRMTWPDENPFRYRESSIFPIIDLNAQNPSFAATIDQLEPLPVTTRRLLSGYGQERGRIGVEIKNDLPREVEVIWVETWPWWIRGFVSSLESTLNGSTSDGEFSRLNVRSPKIVH
jgi:phosphatidylinositol glycan class T